MGWGRSDKQFSPNMVSGKTEVSPIAATWLQLEFIILTKVSQKEKDKYHMVITLLYGI